MKQKTDLSGFQETVLDQREYVRPTPQAPTPMPTEIPTFVTSPYKMTNYEKSRIVGTRTMQLSNNARPLVDIGDEIDPVKIAKKEMEQGILELYIIRKFANGSHVKIYPTLDNL